MYAEQQARKKEEWRAAIVEAEEERAAREEKKRQNDLRLERTRNQALQHQRAIDEKRHEEEAAARQRLRAKTEAYERRLEERAQTKAEWVRLGGGRVIRPENAPRFREKQRQRAEAQRNALQRVQAQLDAMEETKAQEALAVARAQREQEAQRREEMLRENLRRRREVERQQAEFQSTRGLQERRAKVAVKLKIVERHRRIKEHTAHVDEWRAPTPQRQFLERLQRVMYNDDTAAVMVKVVPLPGSSEFSYNNNNNNNNNNAVRPTGGRSVDDDGSTGTTQLESQLSRRSTAASLLVRVKWCVSMSCHPFHPILCW